MTITNDALDLIVQGPPPQSQPCPPPDMGRGGQVAHHWRPVQTCSLDLTVQGPPTPVLTSGGH